MRSNTQSVIILLASVAQAQIRPLQHVALPMAPISRTLFQRPQSLSSPSGSSHFVPSDSSAPVFLSQSLRGRVSTPRAWQAGVPESSSMNVQGEFENTMHTMTLYRISGDQCSQSMLSQNYASLAMYFVNVKEGTCASQGFTEVESTESVDLPLIGKITVSFFNKAGQKASQSATVSAESSATATLHKISKGECGECTIDRGYGALAVHFANLKRGTCASQGFTETDGSQKIKLPVIGKIPVTYFKKAGTSGKLISRFRVKVGALATAVSAAVTAGEAIGVSPRGDSSQQLKLFTRTGSTFHVGSIIAPVLIGLLVGCGFAFTALHLHSRTTRASFA